MRDSLKEAVSAAKDGRNQEAQLILAQAIDESPDEPQAWYLLSQLVDSKARRAAYLRKTLLLAPDHERAKTEYDQLPEIVTESLPLPEFEREAAIVEITEADTELHPAPVAAEEPINELPSWLAPLTAEEAQKLESDASLVVPAKEKTSQQEVSDQPEVVSEVISATAEKLSAPDKKPITTKSTPPPVAATRKQPKKRRVNRLLSVILIFLALITIIVLGGLAYVIFFIL